MNTINNFIINLDEIVGGFGFAMTVAELFNSADLPVANEYSVNWSDSDFDITIESIEADGTVVWQESMIDLDDWSDHDDMLVEGLSEYIENNII